MRCEIVLDFKYNFAWIIGAHYNQRDGNCFDHHQRMPLSHRERKSLHNAIILSCLHRVTLKYLFTLKKFPKSRLEIYLKM